MSKEVLSRAVDAAASRQDWDALLDAMERDPALKANWSRSWQLRDACTGVAVSKGNCSFAAGVMSAIAQQDEAAPSKVVALPVTAAARPAALPVRKPARSWKTLVPVSAAAGALAAALLFGINKSPSPSQPLAAAAPVQVASVPQAGWRAASEQPGQAPDADTNALLDSYLMEHSNSVARQDVGGALAGARFAVQAASYQPGE